MIGIQLSILTLKGLYSIRIKWNIKICKIKRCQEMQGILKQGTHTLTIYEYNEIYNLWKEWETTILEKQWKF